MVAWTDVWLRLEVDVVGNLLVGDAAGLLFEANATDPGAPADEGTETRSIFSEELLVGGGMSAEFERGSKGGACWEASSSAVDNLKLFLRGDGDLTGFFRA